MKTIVDRMIVAAFMALTLVGVSPRVGATCFGMAESRGCIITPLPSPPEIPTTGECQGTSAKERIVAPLEGCGGGRGCVISGGGGADRIIGSAAGDLICGQGGADLVTAGKGNDAIAGGRGDDDLFGEDGHDALVGEEGDDLLHGGRGNDVNTGNRGRDVCLGANINVGCELVRR